MPNFDKLGYDRRIAMGSLAGAGTLGFLIPPLLSMIVYAINAMIMLIVVGAVFLSHTFNAAIVTVFQELPRSSLT